MSKDDKMTKEDRIFIIDWLVEMTGKGEDYFKSMDNKRLGKIYDFYAEHPND